MPHGGQEGGGVLPNGGGREQRERLPFFYSPLFSSFNSFSFVQNFPPLSVFQPSLPFSKTLPPPFKNSPPGKLIVSGLHRHKWSGAAACA